MLDVPFLPYHCVETRDIAPAHCGPKKTDEGSPMPTSGDGGGQYGTSEQWKEDDSLSQHPSDPAEQGKKTPIRASKV